MDTFELILLLLAAVLASSVISQFFRRIPTSLIQIIMGLGIAMLSLNTVSVTLDPELFLVLFIAPLLYDDARNSNIADLWHYRKSVLVYAVGLVVAIVLIVGFSLHLIMPSVPLAAAFALGAALGPTDAVAVSAVSKNASVSKRNLSILKGEALLNDASGLVSFQFAVAAVITGGFSLGSASLSFAVLFFGGVAVGAICGLLINYSIDMIRDMGLQDTTFHVLLELFIPFIVFLLAEAFHVSGIIAVVVTGIVNMISPRKNGVTISRTSIVSSSVWEVLAFTLNGVVFVMLGAQLPGAMASSWENYAISKEWLLLVVVAVTFALEAVRFLFSLGVEWMYRPKGRRALFTKDEILSALALTLSGAKGAISLSIMFTLPMTVYLSTGETAAFPYRDMLIFVASGTIILTLLLANFVVPLIAPKKVRKESEARQHEIDTAAMIDVLRSVIEYLNDRQTRENARATASVVAAYNDRIARIKDIHGVADDQSANDLALRCLEWERSYVVSRMNEEEVDPMVGFDQLAHLNRREELLRKQGKSGSLRRYLWSSLTTLRAMLRRLQHRVPFVEASEHAVALRLLRADAYRYVIDRLQQDMSEMDEANEAIAAAILRYQRYLQALAIDAPSLTARARISDKADEIELAALRKELHFIQEAADGELMSKAYAKRARENVYLMQIDLEGMV